MSKKLSQLTPVTTVGENAKFYLIDPDRPSGDRSVGMDKDDVKTLLGSSGLKTGTQIDLSNPLVNYYNMLEEDDKSQLQYTLTNSTNGGKARLLVNAPSLPVIIGAVNIKGDDFQENTNIYLEVENSGGRVEYWVKQINLNPFVDLTALPFGNTIAETPDTSTNLGSPSIIRTSTGRLLYSFDYNNTANDTSSIYYSDNNGQTNIKITDITGIFWATLYQYLNDIYLIGVSNGTLGGDIVITKSSDDGNTWSPLVTVVPSISGSDRWHTTSSNIIIKDGYLIKSFESWNGVWASGFRETLVLADLTDLMNPSNWSYLPLISFDVSAFASSGIYSGASAVKYPPAGGQTVEKGFLEGCIVELTNGNLRLFLRLEQTPNSNNGLYLDVNWNSVTPTSSTINPTHNFIDMPGGNVKFVILNDATSNKLWSVTNLNRFRRSSDCRIEAFLISSSDDGVNWDVHKKVLGYEPTINWQNEINQLGVQYSQFIIDGNDILIATRTADLNAFNWHDANLITLTQVDSFRDIPTINYVDGSLIIDENSARLEDGNGLSIIHDQSKYYNSPFMLNADNANKPNWVVDGIQFNGSTEYMRVQHNQYLNPDNGLTFFAVIENIQAVGRIISKPDGGNDGFPKGYAAAINTGLGLQLSFAVWDDFVIGNDYIFAGSYANVNSRIYNYLNGVNRGLPNTVGQDANWNTAGYLEMTTPYTVGNIAELTIFRRSTPTGLYSGGKLRALHIMPRYMTPTEMVDYQTALNAIYNIY